MRCGFHPSRAAVKKAKPLSLTFWTPICRACDRELGSMWTRRPLNAQGRMTVQLGGKRRTRHSGLHMLKSVIEGPYRKQPDERPGYQTYKHQNGKWYQRLVAGRGGEAQGVTVGPHRRRARVRSDPNYFSGVPGTKKGKRHAQASSKR